MSPRVVIRHINATYAAGCFTPRTNCPDTERTFTDKPFIVQKKHVNSSVPKLGRVLDLMGGLNMSPDPDNTCLSLLGIMDRSSSG